MDNKQKIGKIGEQIAVNYLKQNGYKIKETNFRTRHGEIDVIVTKDTQIIFVEVKTRSSQKYGFAIEAIDKKKQKKIYDTAKYYLYINNIKEVIVRIDAIEVYIFKDTVKINHIKQIL